MSGASPGGRWHRQAAAAIFTYPYLKGIGTTVFISLFFVAYFYVLHNPARPPAVMPVIWLDRWITFQPLALPVYLSLWLYVSLVPAFFSARAELYRYALSMAAMCILGLSIFYVWPTAAPAPDIDWARYPDLDFLKDIDASGNACPSLHVATAFLSGIWFHHLLGRFGAPAWVLACNWVWCAAIIYSTMAIRQHVAVDAIAGVALGAFFAALALGGRRRRAGQM